jgi:photosystem II stability/assembly factor-like uncharacterized protein
MKGVFFSIFWLMSFGAALMAQQNQPAPTAAAQRIASFEQRKALKAASVANGIPFRNIGPTVMSGRVVDVDVSPTDPTHFFVAYASGGLWKTENNGTTFSPLFDHEMVMTIGDVAVNWQKNILWLGTGEVNSSRSSYAGNGMYKSMDGGKSWQYMGLGESHHIGRIVLHPTDPNTLWVSVLGHLYSPNAERGVYKTSDGGKTWKKVLYVNENTGVVDMVIDPANPKILYAASWERTRRAWDFQEAGPGSAIYKSTDGGEKWSKLPASGLPVGSAAGRIGLAIAKSAGKTVLFAAVDNYGLRPEKEKDDALTTDMLQTMTTEDFLKLPKYKIREYLSAKGFPEKYSTEKVIELIKTNKIKPAALADYTRDANATLLSSEVVGLEIYRSSDAGLNFTRTHTELFDNVYSSYGYYFGQIRVAPDNINKLYVMGVPVLKSDDGGKNWSSINGDNVHADHHALWISPSRNGHLILGNDGGINISYDDGKSWIKCNNPPLGQFYAIAVDMNKPFKVYGGLQDNGVWYGPSDYKAGTAWQDEGQYPYKSILGGDGMQVAVDTRDNATVYTGFQFGNYFRINTKTGERKFITPKHDLGEPPLRWNWQTPIHLSTHNQDILYMGANRLYRSFNQGDEFQPISPDLTGGGQKGDVPYGTLTTIHESPLRFGLLYTGSDDGLVQVSRDGGVSWQNISAGLPKNMWITRVIASAHQESRVYVTLNGYRWDHFDAYVFVSEDYGQTWKRIATDLPLEPVNVIKEDPRNPNLLYIGSDHGLYVSLNAGQSTMLLDNGLPAVAIHDLVIHPRDNALVVGTHGRSIYLGNVGELQQLTPELMAKPLHVFDAGKMRYSPRWGAKGWWVSEGPQLFIPVWAKEKGTANLTITSDKGLVLRTLTTSLQAGLQFIPYDLIISTAVLTDYNAALNESLKADQKPVQVKAAPDGKVYLYKGTYTIKVTQQDAESMIKWTME